ncbi:hypothetical protein JCM19232_673 [Vibrio ishigakensis]|uniref:Uncharacterized protein n=1 Tax=Vibrio ishigakensis TaxID=1481914 RepID=A0A0B8P0N3_9VIBR|nr:hypothetical protein JCM19232_673 [Vibrio ishigakensis]
MQEPQTTPETILEHATAKVKQNGGQLTDKRKKILLCMTSSDKALSAYEVADLYKEQYGENMSRCRYIES